MKNTTKFMTLAAVMVIGTAAFAGPGHHHHKRDGLDLAYGIVNLVTRVINPNRTVIVNPAPVRVVEYRRPAPPPRHQQPRHQPPRKVEHRPGNRDHRR